MSKINELIDRLIAIKDQLNNQYNKDTINEVCGILAKVECGELVEVVRCKDCNHSDRTGCSEATIYCDLHEMFIDVEFGCERGERSSENEND